VPGAGPTFVLSHRVAVKAFFAYFFISLVLLQSFSREVLLVDFTLNQSVITARYCVNKARPMLHCDGKCYFAKKARQQEERQKSAGPVKERLEMLPAAFGPWPALAARQATPASPRCYAALVPGHYAAPLGSVFRPPLG
jgi:hypothetical protein